MILLYSIYRRNHLFLICCVFFFFFSEFTMAESLSEVSSSMEGLEGSEEGKLSNKTFMTSTGFAVYCHEKKEPGLIRKGTITGG